VGRNVRVTNCGRPPATGTPGLREEDLKATCVEYKRGQVVFADAKTDRILGAHIIGWHAGDLIAELNLAMEFHGSAEDVARATHAHPNLAEAIKEAALDVDGRALHGA